MKLPTEVVERQSSYLNKKDRQACQKQLRFFMVRPEHEHEHEHEHENENSEAEAKALKTLVGFAQKDIKEGRTISSGQLKDRLAARKRTTEQ
ncbi:hypothetical protein [Vibrio diabolicus]|uniref:hypothetical protein n=1 Tax=Vibrio diabolicus TaxID=50719 RepID=UPI002160E2F9|nr:hypothetical protein [Vibrio diabolicus]MCS0310848.1 hypothetical protein [Vibrio diabolicus]